MIKSITIDYHDGIDDIFSFTSLVAFFNGSPGKLFVIVSLPSIGSDIIPEF